MPASAGHLYSLSALRIVSGVLMLVFHGWGKLVAAFGFVVQGQDWPFVQTIGSMGLPFPSVLAIASALAESVASSMVAIGLFTRVGAAILAVNMAVAVAVHVRTDMRLELAGLYLAIMLVFAFFPPTPLSIGGISIKRTRG